MEIMKGGIALKILEIIAEKGSEMAEVFDILLAYPTIPSSMKENVRKVKRRRIEKRRLAEERLKKLKSSLELRERYRNIIRWLERDGMLKKPVKRGKKLLEITQKGRKYLERLRARKKMALPSTHYKTAPSAELIAISFDIPQKEANKRDWLRTTLKSMNFRMKQKSLWVGHVKIPKAFMEDLCRIKLIGCVEIFKPTKGGGL